MGVFAEGVKVADGDFFVNEDGDAVADADQRVEVVGDHDDSEAEAVAQRGDEFVEVVCADGVEAGGGFVEEEDFGIQREGAGEADAFLHAAGKLGRGVIGSFGLQADEAEFDGGEVAPQGDGQVGEFAHRHEDILCDGEAGEQSSLLKQDAPAAAEGFGLVGIIGVWVFTEDADFSGVGAEEADHLAHKDGFSGAGAADNADDLALIDGEVEVLVDGVGAEAGEEVAHGDDGGLLCFLSGALVGYLVGHRLGHQMFNHAKRMEKMASSKITRKMAWTTERVVSWPTLSALPETRKP